MSQPVDVKSVEWSYPTSPNAAKFGRSKTGCWTVELYRLPDGLPRALKAFDSREEALEYARKLPCDWSQLFKKFHAQDAQLYAVKYRYDATGEWSYHGDAETSRLDLCGHYAKDAAEKIAAGISALPGFSGVELVPIAA